MLQPFLKGQSRIFLLRWPTFVQPTIMRWLVLPVWRTSMLHPCGLFMVYHRDSEGAIRLSSVWMHEAASVMSVKLVKPRWFDWCCNYSTQALWSAATTAAAFYCLVLETSVSKAASDSSSVSDCHGSLSSVHFRHPTLRMPTSV